MLFQLRHHCCPVEMVAVNRRTLVPESRLGIGSERVLDAAMKLL